LFQNSSGKSTRERIALFRKEFKDFKHLSDNQLRYLIEQYDENFNEKYRKYSMPLIIHGSLFLWAGWFFFNAASGDTITNLKD